MTRVSDAVELGGLARRRRSEQRETQQNLADVCRVGRGSVAKAGARRGKHPARDRTPPGAGVGAEHGGRPA